MSSGNALSALGLDQTEEGAYRALLALRSIDAEGLANRIGLTPEAAARVLERLLSRGLVKMVSDGSFAASAPDTAVSTLLANQLDRVRRGYDALAGLEQTYRDAQARQGELPETETVTGSTAIVSRLSQLQERAQREVRTFVRPPLIVADIGPDRSPPEAGGVRYRSLYEKTMLDDPDAMEIIKASASDGKHVRFAATLPLKLMVVDESIALIMDADHDSALVTEHPTLVTLAVCLFEQMWPTAIPAPMGAEFERGRPTEPGLSDPDDRLLLSLLLSGLTDQAIAARLGVGLRTVQRRVRDLMDAAEVDTRIQLGWQASRRGWVD